MTHQKIIRKQIEGTLGDDKDIPRMRKHFEDLLIKTNREDGLVPVLDLEPSFSLKYSKDKWHFLLSIHFIKVGQEKAKRTEGTWQGKLLPRSIHPEP